jgi:hypothetical protein
MKTPHTMIEETRKASELVSGLQDVLEQWDLDLGLIPYSERAKLDSLWKMLNTLRNDLEDAAYEMEAENLITTH